MCLGVDEPTKPTPTVKANEGTAMPSSSRAVSPGNDAITMPNHMQVPDDEDIAHDGAQPADSETIPAPDETANPKRSRNERRNKKNETTS